MKVYLFHLVWFDLVWIHLVLLSDGSSIWLLFLFLLNFIFDISSPYWYFVWISFFLFVIHVDCSSSYQFFFVSSLRVLLFCFFSFYRFGLVPIHSILSSKASRPFRSHTWGTLYITHTHTHTHKKKIISPFWASCLRDCIYSNLSS